MILGASIAPTEAAAHARRREFHRKIAARAVPDRGISLRPDPPVHVAPEPPSAPSQEEWVARQESIHPPLKPWFEVISETELNERSITISEIQRAVADHFGLTRADLTCEKRTWDIVRPRQIAIYLARHLTKQSFPEIGRRFGRRDHSTALSSVRKIDALLSTDPSIAKAVTVLRERLERVAP